MASRAARTSRAAGDSSGSGRISWKFDARHVLGRLLKPAKTNRNMHVRNHVFWPLTAACGSTKCPRLIESHVQVPKLEK